MADKRTRRVAFYVNGTTAAGVLVLLAATALVANPPAPPTIAEFAPSSQQQIEDAPEEQSAQAGDGAGGQQQAQTIVQIEEQAAAVAADRGEVVQEIVGIPSAVQCFTWPDGSVTQTFDPQSPPCVASWPDAAKGNGGATSPGVTDTEIRIAMPYGADYLIEDGNTMAKFFDSHFQFYGRHLNLVPYEPVNGIFGTPTPEEQLADVENVAALDVFAALDYSLDFSGGNVVTGDISIWLERLSQRGIIATLAKSLGTDLRTLSDRTHVWSYAPQLDLIVENVAAMACSTLAGQVAAHAGDLDLQGLERKFLVFVPDLESNSGSPPPDLRPISDALQACGASVDLREYQATGATSQSASQSQIMLELKQDQVTTIILFTANASNNLFSAASQVNYHPEWMVLGIGRDGQENWGGTNTPADQNSNLFGFATINKRLPLGSEPWHQAMSSVGTTALNDERLPSLYKQLLMLSSGIQAAGPQLTPETFAAALEGLSFANPGAASSPSYQGTVGFRDGRHTMVSDIGLWWWDPTGQNTSGQADAGGYCYLGNGTRWTRNTWPAGDPGLFDRSAGCR